MDNLIISKATDKDAAAILEYLNLIGGESNNLSFGKDAFITTPVEREAEMITAINSSPHSVMLVGKIGEELVAIGNLQGSARLRFSHRGDLGISVRRKYWGLGVGKAMMSQLIEYGREVLKLSVIELQVKSDNKAAISLYESFGFEHIGIYKRFFKIEDEYYDACLMNLYM